MKQFVVTGCSRGIGRATVEYLLAAGHQVHALSRNKDLQIPGATMHAVDLRSDDSIKAWARSMESSGSVIDALINNAGALVNKPFVSMERSDFHDMADVNWAGTAMLTQAALPLFSKKAHILNISSMGCYQGAAKFPGLSAYDKYHYNGGFNHKGMIAWILSGYIAVGSVWPNILFLGLDDFFANLGGGGGYAWIIGASLGAVVHLAISKRS
jgi:nucleoside-diphosphate-sugar epimerase